MSQKKKKKSFFLRFQGTFGKWKKYNKSILETEKKNHFFCQKSCIHVNGHSEKCISSKIFNLCWNQCAVWWTEQSSS